MKVALVHDWLVGMRGGEKCLEVLCRRFPRARLFTLFHSPGSVSPTIDQMRIVTSPLQWLPGARRYYRYLLPVMPAALSSLKVPGRVDLVLSFSHAVAKGIRPPPGVPHVCYCFTPMRYAWHRRGDYLPGRRRTALWSPLAAVGNLLLDWMCRWDRATSGRVTHFVAASQTVARRIAQCYGRQSRVIYPPVDTRFYSPASLRRQQFYVCLSALVPYKRIDLAIEACNRLRRSLVVIGTGPQRRRLQQMAGPTVKLLGWCTDQQIRDYLRRARALLFPAHEDFGIVPLEAQACGTPVIAFGRGGATETVLPADGHRQGTGLLFEQQTPESLCAAILRLEAHPHWFSPRLARQQAERFATERFERQMLEYLEQVVAFYRRRSGKPPSCEQRVATAPGRPSGQRQQAAGEATM